MVRRSPRRSFVERTTSSRHLLFIFAFVFAGVFAETARAATSEVRCQQALAKSARKYVREAHRAEIDCANAEAAGSACDNARLAEREQRAAAKLQKGIADHCNSQDLTARGFPAQCTDDDGAPFSPADAADCVRATHAARVNTMIAYEYPGAPSALNGDDYLCQQAIGRAGRKFADAHLKARQACLDKQLKGQLSQSIDCYDNGSPRATGDGKTDKRLSRAAASLAARIAADCVSTNPQTLGYPAGCDDPDGPPFTLEDLSDCIDETHGVLVVAMAGIEYAAGSTPTTTLATTTTMGAPTTTIGLPTTTLPNLDELQQRVSPNGDADLDGYSNASELALCSNPADAASTPANDSSLCLNQTIFSDTLGEAWGNTNNLSEPGYHAATTALVAQNVADCGVYCSTTSNIGSPEACYGEWPWCGVPEHSDYEGETVEVTFPDEVGNRLHGTIFLPPDVSCVPNFLPTCVGVTDAVVCTSGGAQTYPAVVISDGFIGSQRMYFWAAHRLAHEGYIAMTFDVSGQGRSQGAFPNGDDGIAADLGGGDGFSRDIGTAMNFITSAANPARNLITVDPMLIANQATGAADHTEDYVLGLAGHSAGATAAIAYQQSTEAAYPVRSRAVVGWSHFDRAGTIGNVPVQMHSGDEDSGFIQPPGSGNTVPEQERRFDRLGGDRNLDTVLDFTPHDRQILITEDGTHLSYSQGSWFYYPTWSEELQYHYTLAWFDKYLKDDVARTMSGVAANVIDGVDASMDYQTCFGGPGCFTATDRLKMVHTHLSDIWCSRYEMGGDADADMKGAGCQTE